MQTSFLILQNLDLHLPSSAHTSCFKEGNWGKEKTSNIDRILRRGEMALIKIADFMG